jgi:uncharacterized membrane protein
MKTSMLHQLRAAVDSIRSSLWFWPVLMTSMAVALAQAAILLDQSGWIERQRHLARVSDAFGAVWLFGAGVDGARSLLATIAGSMISIAATVFSITIVALSLAAGQMGPRLLRTFMRDRGTQLSLGMFIATFAFCIVVLGVVNASGAAPFVPKASVTAALALALISLAVLIYFIHHVATSIQAPEVIAVVGAELDRCVEELFPQQIGSEPRGDVEAGPVALPAMVATAGAAVRARASGYVQQIDAEALVDIANRADIVIGIERRPGDHVIGGTTIARIWPVDKCTDDLCGQVCETIVLGAVRTPLQDVKFLINQLVEIAQRALSPGINDPSTAEACIDRLGVALGHLTQRRMPSSVRVDASGRPRVIVARVDSFKTLLDAALDPIRHYSASCVQVSVSLARLLADLAQLVHHDERRQALLEQAQMIQRSAQHLPEIRDRRAVEEACQRAIDVLSVVRAEAGPKTKAS